MKATECCRVDRCCRLRAGWSTHCHRHAKNLNRFGHPEAMAIRYDRHIKPGYHAWVEAGFVRNQHQTGPMDAGLRMAQMLLDWTPTTERRSCELEARRYLDMLVQNGVAPKDVLIRVAEFVAWMENNPGRVHNLREENSHLARLVLTLVTWKLRYKQPEGKVVRFLGELIREHCMTFATKLVQKIRRDADKWHDLKMQSGDFA
jgi:hypothetical protein